MKKILSLVLISFSLLCSWQKISKQAPEGWDPVGLSKSEIIFDADGGSCTIESTNYKSWRINAIEITGTEIYYRADPGENHSYLSASGDGISAKVGSKKNTVVITVDPSSEVHDWKVIMRAGNAFTSIRVKQN